MSLLVCVLFGLIGNSHFSVSFSVNVICVFFLFVFSFCATQRMDTDNKTMLKHLKIFYHSLSFTAPSIIHHFSWRDYTVCASVSCFCKPFLYESCKMANIHLLYKVSFSSSTIAFGFLSFFMFFFISGANFHSSEHS